jgi:hypothetical protein
MYSLPPVKRYPSVADKHSHLGDNTSYRQNVEKAELKLSERPGLPP